MYVGMNSFLLGLLIILNNPINFTFLVIFFFIVRNLFVIKEELQMEKLWKTTCPIREGEKVVIKTAKNCFL